jgi:THO complex subunit 2
MSSALASSQELQLAVDQDPDKCNQLILQALRYGTEAPADDDSSLKERTNLVCKLLTDAWEECPNLEDTLVDGLWFCCSTGMAFDDRELFVAALAEIVRSLVQVPGRSSFWIKLQSNLIPILLDKSGLASEQELSKKLIMHNTQTYYKQQKYNLLQEESEGYAKVLSFLTLDHDTSPEQRRRKLSQLIGIFELDPNRVLDLVIDILEAKLYPSSASADSSTDSLPLPSEKPQPNAHITWLLGLLTEFSHEKLPPLIGFKLAGGNYENKEVSPSLLRTIAFLASRDLLDLQTVVQKYLPPIEDIVEAAHKIAWTKEKRRIQALAKISLSGASTEDPKQAEYAERLKQSLDPVEKSHVVQLLLILLEWREWKLVKPLLSPEMWSHLCTLLPTKVGFALCDLAQERLLPLYQSHVSTPKLSSKENQNVEISDSASSNLTFDQVVQAVSDPLLCTVKSSCIAFRPVLYCQLCRLFRALLNDGTTELDLSDDTYNFFKTFLVPSLSLFSSNPAISTELWSVLSCLPYATRYRMYGEWRGAGLATAGLGSSGAGKPLANVESEMEAGKATRYSLKRLSKDNIRDMSRQLAKVTHSNPMVVFTTILNQIESYDNMVEVMVEATRFVNPLGLDVLGYCILSRLSGMAGGVNRSRLKGMNKNDFFFAPHQESR